MEFVKIDREKVWERYLRRPAGLAYLGIGMVFGFCTFMQIKSWAAGNMEYYQPHACGCLQCFHETKEAPDGRIYCAEFPPEDIKMSGISGVRYRINQIMGGISGLFGLVFAGMTVFFGGRWLIGPGRRKSLPVRLKGILVLAPLVTVAAPVLVRLFLWPLGFFSIG